MSRLQLTHARRFTRGRTHAGVCGLSYRCGCAAGSRACWGSRSPRARPVCGWWRSAPTAGWSPPGWPTGWPHQCAGPAACCHPSSSRSSPEKDTAIQTRCHADKLTISCSGKVFPHSRGGKRKKKEKKTSFFPSFPAQSHSLSEGKLNPHNTLSSSLSGDIRRGKRVSARSAERVWGARLCVREFCNGA